MCKREPLDTIEYNGLRLDIFPDEIDESPREWDNFGIMACWHNRYNLGDEFIHQYTIGKPHFDSPDDFLDFIQENKGKIIVYPLYLYDHSGITISTGREYPFNCPWDSGQVGFIYATYQMIRDNWGVKRVNQSLLDKAKKMLFAEVAVYDDYLTGNVYGYEAYCLQCGEFIDSCYGFYGDNFKENGLFDSLSGITCDCSELQNLVRG